MKQVYGIDVIINVVDYIYAVICFILLIFFGGSNRKYNTGYFISGDRII